MINCLHFSFGKSPYSLLIVVEICGERHQGTDWLVRFLSILISSADTSDRLIWDESNDKVLERLYSDLFVKSSGGTSIIDRSWI